MPTHKEAIVCRQKFLWFIGLYFAIAAIIIMVYYRYLLFHYLQPWLAISFLLLGFVFLHTPIFYVFLGGVCIGDAQAGLMVIYSFPTTIFL